MGTITELMSEKSRDLTVMSAPEPEILALVEVPAWCDPRHIATAWALSDGCTVVAAAKAGGVSRRVVYDWLGHPERGPEFKAFVDRLTMHTGLAAGGERVRAAKGLYRDLVKKEIDVVLRKHDAVDLLRYIREEVGPAGGLPDHPVLQFISARFEGPTVVKIESGDTSALPAGDIVDVEPVELED